MWKPLIELRKKTLLRWKVYQHKKWQERNLLYPLPSVFFEKVAEVKQKFAEAERKSDEDDILYLTGSMDLIDWILEYGKTNEKRDSS